MAEAAAKRGRGRPKGVNEETHLKRRRQLIDAAIDSITEHGMSGTTLATVSKAAGLSEGSAVFYFKTKQNLLIETLRAHYQDYQNHWLRALNRGSDDPIDQLCALALADMDPAICNPRTLALWNSYWGEAGARPSYAEVCDAFDGEREKFLLRICEAAAPLADKALWTPHSIMEALDMITDGLWTRLHISPDYMGLMEARALIARLIASIFPDRTDQIMERAGVILK